MKLFENKFKLSIVLLASAFVFNVWVTKAQSIEDALTGKIDITVDINGFGDYTSINEAFSAIPDNNASWKVIFVRKGEYYEKVVLGYKKTFVILVGEDVDSTIITFDENAQIYKDTLGNGHTFSTYTFRADANDFQAYNITFRNNAAEIGRPGDKQAVAFHSNGDRQLLYHCRILGDQDTYFDNFRTRRYLKDCYIEGGVDFIFGFGVTLFDSCQIQSIKSGWVTAASTPQFYEFGYVFKDCRITNNVGTTFKLGRPWFDWSNTVFYECWEGKGLDKKGWDNWDGRGSTCFYREHNCFGPGSDIADRIDFGKQLEAERVDRYIMDTIFAASNFPSQLGSDTDTAELMHMYRRFEIKGYPERADTILMAGRGVYPEYPTDDWSPEFFGDVYNAVRENTIHFMDSSNFKFTVDDVLWNGNSINQFRLDSTQYAVELDDTVTIMPQLEILGSNFEHEITYPSSLPGEAKIKIQSEDHSLGDYYYVFFSQDSAYWSTEADFVINYEDTISVIKGIYDYNYTLVNKTNISNFKVIRKYPQQYYKTIKPSVYPGIVKVYMEAVNGVTSDTFYVHVDVSINTEKVSGGIQNLFIVNPVKDKLLIYNQNKNVLYSKIIIYDVSGKMVSSTDINNIEKGINELNIDIEKMTKGVYIYNLFIDKEIIRGKLIKTN